MSPYEREVWKVESIIRQATGLRRITKRHDRYYVEFRVRAELRARAVTAVRIHFGPQSDASLLGHNG
jgi:SPX domain protein involved in polyphosphate accumulation